ncbi:hypothetical protein OG21DRAFT_1562360 [Imleria badia]|nr:hypothetical protein OG21DRAFT_1562360 [Imleria badia]
MSPRWTEELLVRSEQAPLKLHVHLGFSYPLASSLEFCFAEPVTNHVERIQELDLRIPPLDLECNEAHFLSKLSSPAPRLRHPGLKISISIISSEWNSVLFHGDTPALRTLVLSNCPLPWYSFKLNGLATLILYDVVPLQFRQNMEDFLATLSYHYIYFSPSIMLNDRDRIIFDLCCSVPSTNVQSVDVIRPPLSSAFWRTMLGHFQNLRHLKLGHGDMPDLASILTLAHHDCTEKDGHADRGPALEELGLCQISLSGPPAADSIPSSLYDVLSTRAGFRGRLTMTQHASHNPTMVDTMVWKWQGGRHGPHVIESM